MVPLCGGTTDAAWRDALWAKFFTAALQRHGISRLPDVDGDKPKRSRFKAYPIGYFHIDIAQVSTEQGKLHLFVAIDR